MGRARPIVVGFGPCGIFAALILAQMGLRPLVLERGKEVRERTKDTWGLWRQGVLDPESNVQFGEGGAGTFSDGKLWSQIRDPRYLTRKVLQEFVKAGAPEEILYVAKPHIGTFRLVGMVEKMRAEHRGAGRRDPLPPARRRSADRGRERARRDPGVGRGDRRRACRARARPQCARHLRDAARRGVHMEAKPFSIGVRIEHPQSLIDRARFGPNAGNAILGAADYKLVHHAKNGRSVYSFCMCPGGTVVAATSEPGCVVTNGMSQYSRNERNANAGIVVGIAPQDYRQRPGRKRRGRSAGRHRVPALLGVARIRARRRRLRRAWADAGRLRQGPAQQRLRQGRAFVQARRAADRPGGARQREPARLPLAAMREALPAFERQVAGFALPDAVLTGVETRTSSPLRITRGRDFQSLNVAGLYPAGEGAGYAGGIMSAGVDGIEVAEALAAQWLGITARGGATDSPERNPS